MKSIKTNYLFNLLVNITSVIFPIITAPYVARVLEPEGVGLFNFSATYAGYFALFALLGIPSYGVREIAKLRNDKSAMERFVSEMISISFIATVIVSVLFILSVFIIGQLWENYIIFLFAGFAIYLAPFKINWFYQGIEDFGYIALRTLVIRILSIICLFLFVQEKSDLIIYVILNVLGGVLADIWNYLVLWRSGIHPYFTYKKISSHIKPLLLLFASTIAISIYTILDTIMLGFIKDYTEVGYYYNASHISKIILSFVTSLSIVVIPRFSFYMNHDNYNQAIILFNKSISFTSFLAFPLSIGLMLIAPVFVPWFFGDLYTDTIIPLMISAYIILAIGFSSILGMQVLVGAGYDNLFLYSILFGAISNFVLNCILIPHFGAIGASIASASAELLIVLIMIYFIYKYTPIRIKAWVDILNSFLGSAMFFIVYLILPTMHSDFLYIVLFVIICGSIYVISQKILGNQSLLLIQDYIVNKIKH